MCWRTDKGDSAALPDVLARVLGG
ncbi:hypothetical protein [Fodinicola feengrottensis]